MPPDNFSKEAKKHVSEAWRIAPIWEDLHKKRVSWEIRLTENERDAISTSITNEEEHNTT